MNEKWIETKEYRGPAYVPVVDYDAWRVAIMRYCDDLLVDNLCYMQKHDETDEVFVLLEGKCILYAAGEGETLEEIEGIDLEPLKVYNVKKGIWHTHALSEDATVLIVENRDTDDSNSPRLDMNSEEKEALIRISKELW